MSYVIYIFRVYFIITFILSLVSLPMLGELFYNVSIKKGYKLSWFSYLPGLCFYPLFIIVNRDFKLFGFIKIKNRKAVAIYYLISSAVLIFLCRLGKLLLLTIDYATGGPITLYANLHFVSLTLFIVQFIIFRIKAYYDLFMACQMKDSALSFALLSVFFPLVFPITVNKLKKEGRLVLLEEPTPATN